MLLVKTKVGPSAIEGVGLFADEFILKGTRYWELVPGFDHILTDEELAALPQPAREYWKHYAYKSKDIGKWILCGDNTRFMNHSAKNPAVTNYDEKKNGERVAFAARDIQPGEELTVDYRDFDEEVDFKIK